MKDFDIVRAEAANADRTFKIGGETFSFKRSVSADLLAAYFDTSFSAVTTNADVLVAADALVLGWLEKGQETKWKKVRAATAADPLSIRDIQNIIEHMTETLAGRPTESPSDSSSTPSETGTTSTDGSHALAAA